MSRTGTPNAAGPASSSSPPVANGAAARSTTPSTTANKAQFLFELGQELKRVSDTQVADRRAAEAHANEFRKSLDGLSASVEGLNDQLREVRSEMAALTQRVTTLEHKFDSTVGTNAERIHELLKVAHSAQEQRLNTEAKEREQSLWGIFLKKYETQAAQNAEERRDMEETFQKSFFEHQSAIKQQLALGIQDVNSTLKQLKETLKKTERMETALKKSETVTERFESQIRRLDAYDQRVEEMRKSVQAEIVLLQNEAKRRVAPEAEQAQYTKLCESLNNQRQIWLEEHDKIETLRKQLSLKIDEKLASLRQEQLQLLRDERKRLTEEVLTVFKVTADVEASSTSSTTAASTSTSVPASAPTVKPVSTSQTARQTSAPPAKQAAPVQTQQLPPTKQAPTSSASTSTPNKSASANPKAPVPTPAPVAKAPIPNIDNEVARWLHSLGLAAYSSVFIENGYDSLKIAALIGPEDLAQMHVAPEHHKDLLSAIHKLS
ncbi:hypothetical protein Pelo_1761 [Pelomyxa schiedti]|nr:hypothetical protein Pelo_1761 [Pelomyxa schiedti]